VDCLPGEWRHPENRSPLSRHWSERQWRRLLRERGKSVKFAFIDAERASFPISRMCHVLGVRRSGFFAWQERPACRRQQQDMIYLALAIVLGSMADNGSMLDLFSRRVVGWATSDRLKRDLAVEALRRALVARNPGPGPVPEPNRLRAKDPGSELNALHKSPASPKAYRHFGHDITDEDHVLEAGLGFAVKTDKGAFIGREAVLRKREAGLTRRMVQVRLKDPERLLFHNEPILRDGRIVSFLTSGNYGHALGARSVWAICLAAAMRRAQRSCPRAMRSMWRAGSSRPRSALRRCTTRNRPGCAADGAGARPHGRPRAVSSRIGRAGARLRDQNRRGQVSEMR